MTRAYDIVMRPAFFSRAFFFFCHGCLRMKKECMHTGAAKSRSKTKGRGCRKKRLVIYLRQRAEVRKKACMSNKAEY